MCSANCLIALSMLRRRNRPLGQHASPRYLAAGDIDGDGDLDFASGNFDGNNISIGLNNGNGTFAVTYGGLDQVHEIELADMDQDGDLDVVGISGDNNRVFVYYNIGAGVFDDVTTYATDVNPNGQARRR